MADQLLDLLDLASPYLPRAVSTPLYTLLNQLPSSLSDLTENPISSILPLLITLFSTYFALTQFFRTLQWGFRTLITVTKFGALASLIGAVWMGYENVGTERGVSGGFRDAYGMADKVARGLYDVGKKGSSWYLGGSGSTTGTSRRRPSRRTTRKTNDKKDGGWFAQDPEERDLGSEFGIGSSSTSTSRGQDTEEFVKSAMEKAKGIWGVFNGDSSVDDGSANRPRTRSSKSTKKQQNSNNDGGFVWNLLANQAKKAFDGAMEGMEQPGAKTKKTSRRM